MNNIRDTKYVRKKSKKYKKNARLRTREMFICTYVSLYGIRPDQRLFDFSFLRDVWSFFSNLFIFYSKVQFGVFENFDDSLISPMLSLVQSFGKARVFCIRK